MLAFIIASQTFIDNSTGYPIYMVALALIASAWFLYKALQVKALVGIGFLISGFGFLSALTNPGSFDQMSVLPFLSHSLLAITLGVAAYTYTATERKPK